MKLHLVTTGLAALAFVAAQSGVAVVTAPAAAAGPCYNGVVPGQPFLPSCTLPGATNKIRGSAPDPNAIIACRNLPGCLSWYVNGP